MEIEACYLCHKQQATETHHIILKSICKPLEFCEKNTRELCHGCHNFIHKDRRGYKKLKDLKMEFQNDLEMRFDSRYLTRKEIKEVLQIMDKPLDRLLKTLIPIKGVYGREDIIRACMGGQILLEESGRDIKSNEIK